MRCRFARNNEVKSVLFRDGFCKVGPTDTSDFSRFENIREITGYLVVEEWPGIDLCIFK